MRNNKKTNRFSNKNVCFPSVSDSFSDKADMVMAGQDASTK